MRAPDCCATPSLVTDSRFKLTYGPISTRVAKCSSCSAMWHETWTSRPRYDGEPDDEVFEYARLGNVIVRCPKCKSIEAEGVEDVYEFTRMKCSDCGHEALADMHRIKDDWNVRA